MKIPINKLFVAALLFSLTQTSVASHQQPLSVDNNHRIITSLHDILHEYARKKITSKDKDGGFLTAISLTAQCNTHAPVSFVAGSNGISDRTPINENSLFQIGSVTKSFVSIVVLQIAKENKISIDDETIIEKWFPEYPKWKHITLRQLMDMTSGIPGNENNLPDDIFKKFTAKEYFNKIEPTKILDLTYTLPLHFKPGAKFEYSNTNYVLLGQFIKKLTHHEPEDEVTMRIINRLGLHNTYFAIDRGNEILGVNKSQLVHGYAFYPKSSRPYSFIPYGADTLPFSLSYTNTAGAMVSTPEDINRYLHAIFDKHGIFYSYKRQLATFVSKQTGQHMLAPTIKNNQGFGLGIIGFYWNKQHPLIYLYNGTTDGFNFAWFVDPETQTYLVFTINSRADLLSLDDALNLFSKAIETCEI
ncbi:MAG: serine hydrolase domain-containing protein [Pseudomonadota bacterium]